MALNVMVFIALVFFLGAIAAFCGLIYVNATKNNLAVGTLVRTTFTANPAVLTTALWGPQNQYGSSATYGLYFGQDATNALHCDMPGAIGLYSTWLSNAGANYNASGATSFNLSQTVLFFTTQTCTQDSDCQVGSSSIPCGPGWIDPIAGKSDWQGGNGIGAYALQCPGGGVAGPTLTGAWCSVCNGGNGPPTSGNTDTFCANVAPDAIGTCMNINTSVPYFCAFSTPEWIGGPTSGGLVPIKQCAAFTNQGANGGPPILQAKSCTINPTLANNTNITFASNTDCQTCSIVQADGSVVNPGQPCTIASWYCNSTDNASCAAGQVCKQITTTNDINYSGWCTTASCGTLTNSGVFGAGYPYTLTGTNSGFCSGTALPNVLLQTTWIAEGEIMAVDNTQDPPVFDVQWERVQNMYGGIGPSLNYKFPGKYNSVTGTYANTLSKGATEDIDWRYSDCRFLVNPDGARSQTRNWSVTQALLGYYDTVSGAVVGPAGLSVFASDPSFTSDILSLLYVSSVSFCPQDYVASILSQCNDAYGNGPISTPTAECNIPPIPCQPVTPDDVFGAATTPPYQRAGNTVWPLQATGVPASALQRIWFYDIMPFNVTGDTLAEFSISQNLKALNSGQRLN